ncbi:MAG: DUF6062 family protein [Thermoprotei archaeon]
MKLFDKNENKIDDQPKDIIHMALKDSMNENGCPVCRLVEKSEYRMIWTLLYEHVNDPFVRKMIDYGNGFCAYHFWKIVNIAQNDPLLGGLGPAIITESLLKNYIENVANNKNINVHCYICSELSKIEDSYVSSFAIKIDNTDTLERYESNDYSILCDKHFNKVLTLMSVSIRDKLKGIQIKKLKKLVENIESYISKHDYRNTSIIKEEEAKAWIQAIEVMKGLGWSSLDMEEKSRNIKLRKNKLKML